MSGLVDWDFAVNLGARVAGDGPAVQADVAAATVAELRAGADRSTGLVREFTGLVAAEHTAPVLVVDRRGWVQANADGFATIIEPMIARVNEKKGASPSGLSVAIGSRVTGAEVGLLLGFLGTKVLGQFDPFHDPSGRLLLVAPNIVHVEREIGADPTDFRLWVCLHEETHRVQFTAVPWMRDHLFSEMTALTQSIEPTRLAEDAVRRISEAVRGGGSLMDVMSTPEQREILDRITGVMSLLEGHADVVMDGVGPSVIPSVDKIRRSFNERRKGIGTLDRVLRRLLGLDAKMAQYRDGASFVNQVVDKVGMEQFNAVWASPANLPSKAEIEDPAAWITRVL
ncbi:zinc-dependent metalloprotease [Nocardioides currus]|uniref:Coenzyme F420 biosynthesis-associated protein n=1 Tax=Nocardioides currus TaxID=2133958 RepID=A0A2R7Z281_9ACTN|nr:zinc-dependent metalloprotease [Nocardioides currus]PUA82751.1 coenzyme F420 biosynthesis-associated protein [Nocardioides currus]